MASHTDEFLARLKGVSETSNGWEARCPCRNDDDNPSLSISEDANTGNILVSCHRGSPCSSKEICESIGLTQASLFPPQKRTKEKLELIKSYNYTDKDGELLFQKLRYVDGAGKKTFRQRKPDGRGGWDYSLGDTPKVLYNLPAVINAVKDGFPVWVVEGEKDADTLMDLGIIATTMPGGRTAEAVAVEVAKYLDYIRDSYQCALWLEHHAPLGESMTNRQLRPFGSAVWSRWPEFGIALTPDISSGVAYTYDVKHFRGARDDRPWPTKIKRGRLFPFEVVEYAKVTK